ncbi:BnaA06g32390D [Brassica napus]|uniref:BnaA06g32390D protein n=1 Tax=Brassica napus TaxID=3708 RepID=A0A078FL88_BRANA|nr:BnaA06g32390D [Brassica napus]
MLKLKSKVSPNTNAIRRTRCSYYKRIHKELMLEPPIP